MPLLLELEQIWQQLSAFFTKKHAFASDPGAPVQLSAGAVNFMLKPLLGLSSSALRPAFLAAPSAHGSVLCRRPLATSPRIFSGLQSKSHQF